MYIKSPYLPTANMKIYRKIHIKILSTIYYNYITIINDASRVVRMTIVSDATT